MNLEAALYKHLKDHAGLAALVSTRIHPLTLPQDPTLPAVTYAKASRVPARQIGGGPVGYVTTRVQVSCWASTYSAAKDVAEQVRDALQSYSGTMGGAGGVTVLDANCVSEMDIYEDEAKVYHVPVDVMITHL